MLSSHQFMGHGICETFNKQSPLAGPNGRPTSNAGVIAEHALKLLRGFCFDCKELRGLAIQIQKLEPAVGATTAMAGQGRLPFPRQKDLTSASTSVYGSSHIFRVQLPAAQEPVVVVQLPLQDAAIVDMGPPSALPRPAFDLPSFSQVDQSVFDALPEDVRKELNAEYDRRSRSRSRSITPLPPPQMPFKQPGQVASPSRTRIFVHGAPAIQRMTRQIAPKRSALRSPTKSWFTKGTGFSALDVNELELKKLDIDIDVFMSLPRELQREQLAVARQIKFGNPLPQPGPRKVIKATVFKPRRGWVNPFKPPPPPKANIPAPPTLKQSIVRPDGAREKVFITDKDDVEDIIERWVDGYNQKGPNTKDVEFFATFLIKSITANKRDGTDGGVEKAIRVLHWWQLLLRRDFASAERAPDAELFEPIGFAWWTAFGGVRSRLNDVMRQRFGGSIGLS
jgi:DNA repair protein REV1